MKKIAGYFLFMIAVSMAMNACRKDNDDSNPGSGSSGGNQVNATITGIVTDESNQPIIGVQVMAYGNVASTDVNGIFVLKGDVNKKRCVLEFSRQGFMKRLHALIPSSVVNYVRIMMQGEPLSQSILTGNGGTVNLGSSGSVVFPANAFVINGTSTPYIGEVMVYTNHLTPDNSNFSMLIPGGDLSGVDANSNDVSLYSYGMGSVTLKGTSGEDLQLANGINATITFPIASSQSATAPQSIVLWYLDEADGLWKEEGQATRVGNNYIAVVTHFTWWNCDVSCYRGTINGRVVDCEGTPLANVIVSVNGQMTVSTDNDGYYTNWVPAGIPLTFQVLPQGAIILPSQLENVAALTNGQTFTVPDLVVPCGSRINGHLVDCDGENISGTVGLLLNNDLLTYVYTADGSFLLNVGSNTNYTLRATTLAGVVTLNVTSGGISDLVGVGLLQACNVSTASTSFTLNGMGYVNTVVNLDIENQNQANYYTWSNNTYGYVNGISNLGPCGIYIGGFEGTMPVTIDATNQSDSIFSLNLNEVYMYPSLTSSNHFLIHVTQYGAVGDSIKGTFSGDVETSGGLSTATITNGKFAFLRGQDY
jgi:hypothetical protein